MASKIAYTTIAVLLVSVSIAPMLSLATADEEREEANRRLLVLRGYGLANDKQDDEVYRSGIRLAGVAMVRANGSTDASNQFNVLRGGIVIGNNESRTVYTVVNDTWSGTVSRRGFVANGAVQDADGNEYRVHLKGDTIRRTQRGIQMLIEGELNGDDASYRLRYIAVLKNVQPRISQPIAE